MLASLLADGRERSGRRGPTSVDRLVDAGHTVVVIEHHLDVVKRADWIVDLGPEAGDAGGSVVAQGTPEQVAAVEESHTGRYLRPLLQPIAEEALAG